MSQTRAIWNDGQGLATPDLQRPCDVAGAADDRVLEILATPGSVQKRVVPLLDSSLSVNGRLLAIPSTAGIGGVTGGVRLQVCELIAGSPSSVQQISLSATLYSPLDTVAIASNSSGSIRYDLIYATLNRAVSVSGTRKIKSATDGTLSSQTINLADAPAVSLSVNANFLTGATAPTLAQINAAVPADTAPSSSTFGSFNFPIAVVTVANGYTAGVALSPDSSGGATFITQAWVGGYIHTGRVRGPAPVSMYYGAANEKPSTSLTAAAQGGERWGAGARQFFAHFKLVAASSSAFNYTGASVLDNTIDWRNRFIWGFFGYIGSASQLPLDSTAPAAAFNATATGLTAAGANPVAVSIFNSGAFPVAWSGAGLAIGDLAVMQYSSSSTAAMTVFTDGSLRVRRGTLVDGANGDLLAVVLYATDQLKING